MEFKLVKEKLFFRYWNKVSGGTDIVTRRCTLLTDKLALDFVNGWAGDGNSGGWDYGVNCFREGLKHLMCKQICGSGWSGRNLTSPSEKLHLTVYLSLTSSKTASVKIVTRNGNSIMVKGAQIFDGLMNSVLLPNSYGFNLKLNLFGMDPKFEINVEDLKIRLPQADCYGIEMKNIEIADETWRQWDGDEVDLEVSDADDEEDSDGSGDEFRGEIALTLRLDHCAVAKLYLESLGKKNFITWPSSLIVEGMESDMVILAGGESDQEKGIKCHKKILSSRSPVFEAMFQADMSESKNSSVEIVDMTEAGVRAMLKFIYGWDVEEASKNCEIALELLEAGHKYQMEYLEDAMMQIIWAKPIHWLSVDLALKLLLFSRKIGGKYEKILMSCYRILKWYAKKPGSLVASEEYRKLFLEYPWIAMEFTESVLKI